MELSSTLQQMAKIAPETPKMMRSTTQSVIIQILLMILSFAAFFVHALYSDVIGLLYSVYILWLLLAIYIIRYEIHWKAYKLSLTSFRGICILISIIVNWLCDISRHFLRIKDDKEPLLTIMMDNLIFACFLMLILAADYAPRVINLVRLIAPFCAITGIAYIMVTQDIIDPDYDYTFFTFYYGSLRLNEIEAAAKAQIIWYGCTFIWAVPRDPKHEYFVFLDTKVTVKTFIPKRIYVDAERNAFSKFIVHAIFFLGILYALIYIAAISWREYDDVDVSLVAIDIILMVVLIIFIVILIYKHFQWYMMKQLVLQFRVNVLIVSVLILIYAAIQKLVWKDMNDLSSKFVIETLLNQIIYAIACIVAIIRDSLNISYPNYCIIPFSILLNLISFWNLFLYSFGFASIQYPKWFLLIEKQAYFQVIVITYLWLYYLWRDKEGKYFSLIRKRRATDELWGDHDHDQIDDISGSYVGIIEHPLNTEYDDEL